MQQLIKSLPGHSPEPYPPHLRIADILLLPGDDDDDDCGGVEERIGAMNGFRRRRQAEATCGFECPSPQRAVSRLFRRLKERGLVPWREGNEKESVDCRAPSLCSWATDEKAVGRDGGSSVGVAKSDESGIHGKENVPNMGVACSLLYLIASSKEELSKMKDLRTDMEMLLQNVKEEVRMRDSAGGETSVLKESPAASCLTDLKKVSSCSSLVSCQSTAAPYPLHGEERITISSQSIVCDESRKESVEGMGQLEAELEAELERLQLQLDTESFPQSMKITGNDSTAEISGNSSMGEVSNLNKATIQFHGGVPPLELERKLHELLESRQQERIRELEASLECVKQKLSEKEREATWWKDTALLMSHHVRDPQDRSHNRSTESC